MSQISCYVVATADSSGLESGNDYLDKLKESNDYQLKPLNQFEPDMNKYAVKIRQQLEKLLGQGKPAEPVAIMNNYSQEDVDNLYKMSEAHIAKDNVKEFGIEDKFPNLTIDELVSIYLYTDSGYYKLNTQLRGNEIDKVTSSFKNILSVALDKLPNYKGVVYRGTKLSVESISKYLEHFNNKIPIELESFTSSSISKDKAEAFERNVFFTIKSNTGKHIEKASHFGTSNPSIDANRSEQEVLFKTITRFNVVSVNMKNGRIELEEVE